MSIRMTDSGNLSWFGLFLSLSFLDFSGEGVELVATMGEGRGGDGRDKPADSSAAEST
jgi:hypothetical protein